MLYSRCLDMLGDEETARSLHGYTFNNLRIVSAWGKDLPSCKIIHIIIHVHWMYIPYDLFFCNASLTLLELLFLCGSGDMSDNCRTCFPDLVVKGDILTACFCNNSKSIFCFKQTICMHAHNNKGRRKGEFGWTLFQLQIYMYLKITKQPCDSGNRCIKSLDKCKQLYQVWVHIWYNNTEMHTKQS